MDLAESAYGRNRYIVECKEKIKCTRPAEAKCRNRYIVECKELTHLAVNLAQISRNRYIVECKGASETGEESGGTVEIDTLWNVKAGRR